MWPEKDIPLDYLILAKRLISQKVVTEREFIDLCKMAIQYVEQSKISSLTRSDMAMYIAHIWLNHKNINNVSLLSDIGGQFSEWEVPGAFMIDDEVRKVYWYRLQQWVHEADEKY